VGKKLDDVSVKTIGHVRLGEDLALTILLQLVVDSKHRVCVLVCKKVS